MDILYEFGGYSPVVLIVLSWYLLWEHKNLFFYYNVGFLANAVLNIVLKGLIKEPRPMFDSKKLKLMTTHAKEYFFQNGIPFDMYGMPSGHAQMAFFTTMFVYLSLKHTNLLYLYLLFSLFICYQRVKTQYHSISQVVVGAIVGSGFAYIVYQLAREKIKGKIREREDDYGPV
jgi:dolichyldiphosphatase